MEGGRVRRGLQPHVVASIYVAFGLVYIVTSDYLTRLLVDLPGLQARIQTLKGSAFVLTSGLLIYGMSRYHVAQLRESNDELADTLQQVHILHRILRHNLRNKCNVISGNADRILADGGQAAVETIKAHTAELVALSDKSEKLRETTMIDAEPVDVDLVATATRVLEDVRERDPDVEIHGVFPAAVTVTAHPRLAEAIEELVWNAVLHGEDPIEVEIEDGTGPMPVTLAVRDHGPGMPPMERDVLVEGYLETPTQHSQGIGLWLVRYIVTESNGSITCSVDEPGTTVRVRFHESLARVLSVLAMGVLHRVRPRRG